MQRRRVFICVVGFLLSLSAAAVAADTSSTSVAVNERRLPNFQERELQGDLPVADLFFESNQILWMTGRTSLWRWDLNAKGLQRLGLVQKSKTASGERLQSIGFDGFNLFVAAGRKLFQIQTDPRRVFLYRNPVGAVSPIGSSFAGSGDQFWWVTLGRALRIDRYGHALVSGARELHLRASDLVALEPTLQRLWVARGKSLVSIDGAQANGRVRKIIDASRPLRGLQISDGEVFAHTAYTVMRFDQDGKRLQTIPVEAGRQLHLVDLRAGVHGYFFDDGLLEVFDLKAKTAHRYQLPIETPMQARRLTLVGDDLVALIDAGQPRVFQLAH